MHPANLVNNVRLIYSDRYCRMITIKLERQRALSHKISRISLALLRYIKREIQCLKQNPAFFIMRKTARLEIVRDLVSLLGQINRRIDTIKPNSNLEVPLLSPSLFNLINVPEAVAHLKQEGYYAGLNLPQSTVQAILSYAQTHPCHGDRNSQFEFYIDHKAEAEAAFSRQFLLASYTSDPCLAMTQIINDANLKAIAAQYFGSNPVLVGSELLWSFPVQSDSTQRLKAAQVMHYDIDDYQCLKFFVYLTDVDENSGAHACIAKTHRNKKLLHQLMGQRSSKIADDKLIAEYGGEKKVVTFCGQSGFGFVEDPFCFHRGNPVKQNARLMLQVEYAAHAYENIRWYYEQESTRIKPEQALQPVN
jgi:hypothetical protein